MPLFNNGRNGAFSDSELRAVEHSVLGGRRVLWAGVLAVLLPLAILLGLQYLWLADQVSKEVAKVTLNGETVQVLPAPDHPRYAERPGGYTRIVRVGQRRGDGAERAIIEFV